MCQGPAAHACVRIYLCKQNIAYVRGAAEIQIRNCKKLDVCDQSIKDGCMHEPDEINSKTPSRQCGHDNGDNNEGSGKGKTPHQRVLI